ncbi:MAG TPA: GNAT family N-acetyltransferase [Pirellulales bacterium]|nr:GNAT family N-acetyltransferase [Pirellulales bacterium]
MEQSRVMANVLHLYRALTEPPELPSLPGIGLRPFAGPADVAVWLEIRHRAFAREKVGVRQWTPADFDAEFLSKPWWSPERMWFAEVETGLAGLPAPSPVGTITLAFRGAGAAAQPVIHWLAVLPSCRRRGVARLLLAALEKTCWDAGYREVGLETHAGWTAAVRFYDQAGYKLKD